MGNFFSEFSDRFYSNFIDGEMWRYITDGLKTTLTVTFFAVVIGVVLGFVIALIRATYDRTGKKIFRWDGFGDFLLWFFNLIAKLYLTVIRGTPVVVQLLIIYFVIFASVDIDKVLVAVIAFGINSAAYVAEIFRGGIMSIDIGQLDACVMCGYPGSIASTWQEAGRAGRRKNTALTIVVASSSALDQYIVGHPEYFFGQSPENALVHPDNLYVLLPYENCHDNLTFRQ